MPAADGPPTTCETSMLMDAIQSLQLLHQKSRVQNYAFDNYASESLSEVSSTTPNTFNGSSEHRRKIRELTIALESQAMDETRRFAMQSPMTNKDIKTPRISPVPGSAGQLSRLAKSYLNTASLNKLHQQHTTETAPITDAPDNEEADESEEEEEGEYIGEICMEERKSPDLDEQRKRMESLTLALDAQWDAAMQTQAYYKANPQATRSTHSKVMKSSKNADISPTKTFSTELDTTVASSTKRDIVSASSSGSGCGQNGIILLDNKEDFEHEETEFEHPLSPNSFFVKYGMESSHHAKTKCFDSRVKHTVAPSKMKSDKKQEKEAAVEKATHPGNKKGLFDAMTSKPTGTLEMFKKILVWDVSSEEDESVHQGRLYNDTFEDELSSKYSTSFESAKAAVIKRERRKRGPSIQKQQYIGKSSSADSEGSKSYQSSYTRSTVGGQTDASLSCQTSYTEGRTDGSSSDNESQSFYTTDGSYDSISPSSTRSSFICQKELPLM